MRVIGRLEHQSWNDKATGEPRSRAVIVASQVLFTRKTNRKGKPVGSPILAGFQFTFSTAMNGAAGSAANYQMGTLVTKTVKRKRVTTVKPIGFSASLNAAGDAVTLKPAGKQTFKTGGQITLLASGLRSAANILMSGNAVFNIAKGGKSLSRVS